MTSGAVAHPRRPATVTPPSRHGRAALAARAGAPPTVGTVGGAPARAANAARPWRDGGVTVAGRRGWATAPDVMGTSPRSGWLFRGPAGGPEHVQPALGYQPAT